jgi:hypothetical protein
MGFDIKEMVPDNESWIDDNVGQMMARYRQCREPLAAAERELARLKRLPMPKTEQKRLERMSYLEAHERAVYELLFERL